jgi:ethanolamine ammonia-lyase small subunit
MLPPEPSHPGPNGRAIEAARDPWADLAAVTTARIALGRAGGSLRTESLLDFRIAHARARDAVQSEFDPAALARQLEREGLEHQALATGAVDRRTFLLRPDLGRRLDESSHALLGKCAANWGRRDLVILVSDGLAAQAAERHAVAALAPLVRELRGIGWTLYPILLAPFGRVKLQDEVGAILGARLALMFLGERPGLGAPDSLGAYFTFEPRADRTDADRNCVSNIRPEGLPPPAAARKLTQLLRESARRGLSGVALKDTGLPAKSVAPSIAPGATHEELSEA